MKWYSSSIPEIDEHNIFLNIETGLQIYLTMHCTNFSSERFFSALKRIKTRLGSCLTQDKLDTLTLLTVEHDITKNVSYDDIIDEFAKERRKNICNIVIYTYNI